ncbi:MAG: YeeE/YedE family protein [Rhodospirillaceae bacterium]|jgi:uncharacterized protein|nr:YeeE/YedE family protein [Rhodospirillaceae bacterium]MBT6140068.1 YeeE/YedE family protein [Rhodospirillaceae bacterium]
MTRVIVAGLAGILFGVGLTVSAMINPAKVLGFLDLAGNWDPSLAFVLAGATGIAALAFRTILKRDKPVLSDGFQVPTVSAIDRPLVWGSAVFGIGWGIVGLCPGPTFSTLLQGRWETGLIFSAMIVGMAVHRLLRRVVSRNQATTIEAE